MKKAYLLNGVPPRPFWSTHAKLEEEYEKRIPADASGRETFKKKVCRPSLSQAGKSQEGDMILFNPLLRTTWVYWRY